MALKMLKNYTHETNKEIRSISGGYELDKEEKIQISGREMLYAVGNGLVDSSCCGFWGCRYALVVGYIVRWKYTADDAGNAVSEIDTIEDEDLKAELSIRINAKETVTQIIFL
ncbi:MAG: hypothetical protein WCO26_10050 [Deltaproteobacteria bacterium]